VHGEVCYNGYKLDEFVPQKTSAYISQYDEHIPEMTVREILDFSARCQGIGTRAEMMEEVSRREKQAGIVPDPDIDTYMKVSQMVHITDATVLVSLLQPAPETFSLFDDLIMMAEGRIVYHGPREHVLDFFQECGFRCPERKGVSDFIQEGKKLDEEMSVPCDRSKIHESSISFNKYSLSKWELLKACSSREILLMRRNSFTYVFKTIQLLITAIITMTVFLGTRMDVDVVHANLYMGSLFYGLVILVTDGIPELPMTVQRLQVFHKQKDLYFYPAWAYAIPASLLKVPISFVESLVWTCLTYYVIGYSPEATRFFRQFLVLFGVHLSSVSMFRFIASVYQTHVVSMAVEVIETIELEGIKDDIVGIPGVNGLSTEQRKRLTIAVELVANPSIIFMDEPTTGLDARSAAIVMRAVKNIVDTGRTILILLKAGGRIIYSGPMGHHSSNVIDYFERIEGVPKIKSNYNPATWMLEVTSESSEAKLGVDFAQLYNKSALFESIQEFISSLSLIIHNVGVIFLGINNCSSVLQYVATERTVMYRERFAGMYSTWSFSFAQVSVEVPYLLSQAVLFTAITYPMIGYYPSATKVLWFCYTMFCSLAYFNYLGMLLVSLTPNFMIASILQSIFYTNYNLFTGFLIPLPKVPKWWLWLYYLTPTSWSLNGLLTSQYGDIEKELTVFGQQEKVAEFLKTYFGFNHEQLGLVAAVLIAFPLAFAVLFAYFMGRFNFQRR
ncbi:ABC transporter G family member 33, partial [Linum perenne]